MSQVSTVLRRAGDRYLHWCPACEEIHPLPDAWKFDGNLEQPTFTPSFRHRGGSVPGWFCHYIITKGVIQFCADCSHAMANQSVPMPPLPANAFDP